MRCGRPPADDAGRTSPPASPTRRPRTPPSSRSSAAARARDNDHGQRRRRAPPSVPPRLHVADFLRQQLGLTGTHIGCEQGSCGMCTVVVDGEAVKSCLMLAGQLDGRSVQTVESLAVDDRLSPLQQSFKQAHALQCGFCTPGFLMTATALAYQGGRSPSRERDPRGDRRRAVPLHRIRQHRLGHRELVRGAGPARGRRRHDGPDPGADAHDHGEGPEDQRRNATRRRPAAGWAPRWPARRTSGCCAATAGSPTTSSRRTCCTWRSRAARTPTRASSGSTPSAPTRWTACKHILVGADVRALTEPLTVLRPVPGAPALPYYALAQDVATHEGQAVVSVAATSRHIAEDALALIDIELRAAAARGGRARRARARTRPSCTRPCSSPTCWPPTPTAAATRSSRCATPTSCSRAGSGSTG